MEDRFQVGVLTSPHGVRGEIKVYPTTDDPRRFKRLKEVILDTGKESRILEVEGVKFSKQMVIMKFKGFDTPEDIAKYRQCSIYVTRENAVRLGRDEYFIAGKYSFCEIPGVFADPVFGGESICCHNREGKDHLFFRDRLQCRKMILRRRWHFFSEYRSRCDLFQSNSFSCIFQLSGKGQDRNIFPQIK